tara:strand:+ start:1507 stop:1938 length:432 start_codon:yes stop_codon:yes gene_type:complete
MQKINNTVESEQLKHNGRKPESNRSIRSFYNIMAGLSCFARKSCLMIVAGLLLAGCSEFALLTSGGGLVVNNNAYVKAYNTIDVVTIISTKDDIKTHAYNYVVKPTKDYVITPMKMLPFPEKRNNEILTNFIYPQKKPIKEKI